MMDQYYSTATMGSDDAVPQDSFTASIEDIGSALMEGEESEIDELQRGPQDNQQMNQQDQMLMMMLMQQMGGM
jgi:hypothetical protein